jgi:ketol-acid reductoisomerase
MTSPTRNAALAPLLGERIAVLGFGNQGSAHAMNLRDSGLSVIVGQRPGSRFDQATAAGFTVTPLAEACRGARLVILALPDESAAELYEIEIAPALQPGQAIGFIHGFNIHYDRIKATGSLDVILVAPKGAGYMVRQTYVDGAGLPCMVAIHQDASGNARAVTTAWATGLHAAIPCMIETTFREETETDLFGEQSAVVGGVCTLMRTAFDTLVEAGYDPEHAYFECVHEVKFVVDLIHKHGFQGMFRHISATAAYGGLTREPQLERALKPAMENILQAIRDGSFAAEWSGPEARSRLEDLRDSIGATPVEEAGARVRAMAFPAKNTPTE